MSYRFDKTYLLRILPELAIVGVAIGLVVVGELKFIAGSLALFIGVLSLLVKKSFWYKW